MNRIFSHILIAIFFFIAGIWYGYDKALMNQIYFDAPAKITLYNAVLSEGSSEEFLEGKIIENLRILEVMKGETNSLLLSHPTHVGMEEMYNKFLPSLDALPEVKKAQKFIEQLETE